MKFEASPKQKSWANQIVSAYDHYAQECAEHPELHGAIDLAEWEAAKKLIDDRFGARGWIDLRDCNLSAYCAAVRVAALPLDGVSDKQVAYGADCRIKKSIEILSMLKKSEDEAAVIAEIAEIRSAKAWIERDAVDIRCEIRSELSRKKEEKVQAAVAELKKLEAESPEAAAKLEQIRAQNQVLHDLIGECKNDFALDLEEKAARKAVAEINAAMMALDLDKAEQVGRDGIAALKSGIKRNSQRRELASVYAAYLRAVEADKEVAEQAYPCYEAAKAAIAEKNDSKFAENAGKAKEILAAYC